MATDRTKTCDACGSVNQADAAFCWTCGKSFSYTFAPDRPAQPPAEPQVPEPTEPTMLQPPPMQGEPTPPQPQEQPTPAAPRPPSPQPPPVYFVEPRLQMPEMKPAGFLLRFLAFFIDWIILGFGLIPLAVRLTDLPTGKGSADELLRALASPTPPANFDALVISFFSDVWHLVLAYSLLTVAIAGAYYIIFHAIGGQTIGKALVRIRVLTERGRPIGWFASIIRYVFFWLGTRPLLLFLGVLWVAWDAKKKGWHDHVAGTNVYRTG